MKLKSLLIGSAAAVITAPAAFAADIIIPEPEVVEYVRVCDAAGEGFFYIPGTETCLSIGGFVRVQMDIEERFDDGDLQLTYFYDEATSDGDDANGIQGYDDGVGRWGWEWNTRGQVEIESWTATDLGDLTTKIVYQGNSGAGGSDGNVGLDAAFIELGGLHMGYSDNAFDGGIVGESDSLGGAKVNRVAYTFVANGFDATLSIDDDSQDNDGFSATPDFLPNFSGNAGFDLGMADVRIFGAYDTGTDEFAVKGRVGVDVGADGRLEVAGYYTSGATYVLNGTDTFGVDEGYWGPAVDPTAYATGVPLWSEWSIQGGYQHQVTSDLALTGNVGYWSNLGHIDEFSQDAVAVPGNPGFAPDVQDYDLWNVGAVLDYQITETFAFKGSVTHWMPLGDAGDQLDAKTTGFLRFQADF